MVTYDILLKGRFSEKLILKYMSVVFSISKKDILIVYDLEELEKKDDRKLVCLCQNLEGEFCTFLTFFSKLTSQNQLTDIDLGKKISKQFRTEVLLPSEDENPYLMILIGEKGDLQKVFVDPVDLDENERYTIRKEYNGKKP